MKRLLGFLFISFVLLSCSAQDLDDNDKLINQRITNDKDKHQAFTDLVFFDNHFFLVFRESDKHAYGNDGIIKLLISSDGKKWKLTKEISIKGFDLRDPKFSVNNKELMLYIHGSKFDGQTLISSSDYRLNYSDSWDKIQSVMLDNKLTTTQKIEGNEAWPWRITWNNNVAYAVGYNGVDIFCMYTSIDGLNFKSQKKYSLMNLPTESTIRVSDKGEFYVLTRRNIGTTFLQKYDAETNNLKLVGELPFINFGGPNFLFLSEKKILYSGGNGNVVFGVYDLETHKSKNLLKFGFGDCSYPGMVIKDNVLWLSYYSSNGSDKGTSIYIAKIKLEDLSLEL